MKNGTRSIILAVTASAVLALSQAWAQLPVTPPPQVTKPDEKQTETKPGELPKPDEVKPEAPIASAPVDPKTYKIGREDVIFIRVWREGELSGNYTVRPDGKISMPLAGDIEADGQTPDQLKSKVVTALSEYMTQPEVMVELRQVNSKRCYITGEISKPGMFTLVTPMTVLEALSNAGGLREFAKGNKIVIMRGSERIKFNYKEVIKGKKMEQNILLQPGDHIIIP